MMTQDPMVGKRFGSLVVLENVFTGKNSKKYRECRCDCGNVCVVQESHLKSGHTKSCGCYRKKRIAERWLDLTGQRYGRLTVLQLATKEEMEEYLPDKDGKTGRHEENSEFPDPGRQMDLWLCRCDCGKLCVCQKENLRDGKTKSCGCFREEQRQENMRRAIHFVDGTCVERIACRKTCANNTSGQRGVYQRANGTWRASIGFCGKKYNLGTFHEFEDAVQARLEAERQMYDPFIREFRSQRQKLNEEALGAGQEKTAVPKEKM